MAIETAVIGTPRIGVPVVAATGNGIVAIDAVGIDMSQSARATALVG